MHGSRHVARTIRSALRIAPVAAGLAVLAAQPAFAATVSVAVKDFSFTPSRANADQGDTVAWNFQGPSPHTATSRDANGTQDLGLFNSGVKSSGTYPFVFKGAAVYKYRCSLHPSMTGSVKVPVRASPASGTTSTTFTITWASGAPPSGFNYDVQIKRPGSTAFVDWKVNQTGTSSTFRADAGKGTYSFRSRIQKGTGPASNYSAAKSISVS